MSTDPYVFLRSIIDSIDKPVRLGGILERAALDTLRRTGHQQRPVILSLGGDATVEDLRDCVLASRQVVRDLSWLIRAPPVLSDQAGMELLRLPDSADEATADWLAGLDRNPKALLENLESQSGVKRLGFYAAALTQFWLEEGPGWNTKRTLSAVQLSTGAQSRQTAGQLKLVCLRPGEALHVESSVKFFADASHAEPKLKSCASSYVGPFLHENLAWRLAEARRKITSTRSASVQAYLQKEFGDVAVRSVYFLKGYIFKPLEEFWSWGRHLRDPPAEVNADSATGWYTTQVSQAMEAISPGARLAVLPKLFWLSPAVASGDPPVILGDELPGQQESVPTDWPEKVRRDVEEHFQSVDTALLLCELVLAEGEKDVWVERSRGFILPPVWDPKALMTGGPQGMKNSADLSQQGQDEPPSKWSNQRRKYSERLADTARQLAPSLETAGVHATVPQKLSEELTSEHLVDYVLFAKTARRSAEPSRFQRRLSLRTALEGAEASQPGKVCQLVTAALARLVGHQMHQRSDGHFILELLVKPSEQSLAPSACSVTFEADADAMKQMLALGLSGALCLRLAVKFAARFCFSPPRIPEDQALALFEDAVNSTDRSRLAGLVEYLAASSSLELADKRLPLDAILCKLTMPPADGTVLDLVCQHVPSLCQNLSAMLTSTGQLKLARKIETRRLRGFAGNAGYMEEAGSLRPPSATSTASPALPKLCLPQSVRIVRVEDAQGLDLLQERLKTQKGVIGLDAEWKPWEEGSPSRARNRKGHVANPVQLLQLAWADTAYLLDIPSLLAVAEEELAGLLQLLLQPGGEAGHILVGFGLEGDLRRMADSYPWLMSRCSAGNFPFIEMQDLARTVAPNHSLDNLCALRLGLSLDKSLQCSNWELRPLPTPSIEYAALDAWILLALLGHFLQQAGTEKSLRELAEVSVSLAAPLSHTGLALGSGVCATATALRQLGVVDQSVLSWGDECSDDVNVCKTLACVAMDSSGQGRFCLAVFSDGSATLSMPRLAEAMRSTSARLVTAEELREHFRQPRGCVGPVGPALLAHPPASVVLDDALLSIGGKLSCGGGSPQWHLVATPQEILDWTHGLAAPIRMDSAT
ncbi:mut-7 [Symbiodinium natans]|uniref:Mut-7 protein n=1 Tax=Symbiodinium natans TaxID=878477 RepID=A0A812IEV0_9DINO|nr:mut-7 [Symbiodinium natans]